MILWYPTELMVFVFSLCSSLKVSSFNEPMRILELWHTSCPQTSLYTVWKGWAVANIPSRANDTGYSIQVHLFNAFITCCVWRVLSMAAQLHFFLSMTDDNRVYLLYCSRHDNWSCASRHSWPSLLFFSFCAALVFSSSSLWAAGCVYVFLCR